jgi:protein SCO1/2
MHAAEYNRSLGAYRIPDAAMLDMEGAPLTLREALDTDSPVMVNFVFTSCAAVCPVMSATFSQVQKRIAADDAVLRLVSISTDPEFDTPARLHAYAKRFGAAPGWRFLTGSAESSLAAQRAFDVDRGDKMSHHPVTFLRAKRGEPWVRLDGFANASELVAEYRKLHRGS